jgi:RHS repeat-associated protein
MRGFGCKFTGLVAVAGLAAACVVAVPPAAGAAVAPPAGGTVAAGSRRVAVVQSARLHRVVPRPGAARGYSAGEAGRRQPRMVSEIIGDRTAMSSTWRDADGSLTVRRYVTPHFCRPSRSSGWVPIDTSLSAVAGKPGWWRSGANSWHVLFGPAAGAGGAEQVSTGSAVVGFTPQNTASHAVLPQVSGSTATYRDLWPDTNMVEQVTSEGVAEELVLTGPNAPARFIFGLTGVTARPDRSGGLDLIAGGRLAGTVAKLSVQVSGSAAADSRRSAAVAVARTLASGSDARLSVAGGQVIESVPARWLASLPSSAFPVVIDPSFQVSGVNATSIEGCSQSGCSAGATATLGSGDAVAFDVPYPAPPTVTSGQQPWEPAEGYLDAVIDDNGPGSPCPTGSGLLCEMGSEEVFGEPSEPSSYDAIIDNQESGAQVLYENTGSQLTTGLSVSIVSWLSQTTHQAGSWFALAAAGYTVNSKGTATPASVIMAASSLISVNFVYYQNPAPPAITSPPGAWPADNVVATTQPVLTATRTDTDFCTTTGQAPSGNEYCDQPGQVTYDFQVSTSRTWGQGQVVADSGWIPQPFTTPSGCQSNCAITLQTPTWTVPAGALTDGVTCYVTVQDSDSNQNIWQEINTGVPILPAAFPAGSVEMTVKLGLGAGGPSPTDTVGSPPVQTSVPAQGAPSPGLSPASETVNMVTGNLSLAVGTPSMTTLAGPAGVSLTYNSMQSSTQTGSWYGLNASYYPDSGNHQFPSSPAGSLVEPNIDMGGTLGYPALPPVAGIVSGSAWLGQWTGTITLPAGTWELGGEYCGGLRIYLDGSTTPYYNDWSGTNSCAADPAFAASTITGAHQITVQDWQPEGEGLVQLWAEQITSPDNLPQVVPSSWLSPGGTGLPPGWSLGAATPAWTSATDMGNQIVLRSPSGATATFTSNSNGTWTPQAGDTDWLTVVNGQVQLSAADGYLYVFNTGGQLTSMTTVADDLHPTALQYTWGPASSGTGAPVVLQSITDPVSGRSVTLSYGTASACGDQNNAGLLCGISYWNGTSTSFQYNSNDQLAEVFNPGVTPEQNATMFGYDSDGRLNDIRDALAVNTLSAGLPGEPTCTSAGDDTCVLDTWITYNSQGQVATVTQPQPQPGAARPERTYTYYPSATTPGAGSTTVTIAGFSPAGTGCSQPAPGCSPAGVASTVTYDNQDRVVSQTSSTGLTSYTVWDTDNRPIVTVSPDGEQTSTVYDLSSDITDTYGPAPVACFDPSTIPSGVTVTGPVVGYLPLADPQGASGCGVAVPHTSNAYDQNMDGLADTFWANGQNAGAAVLHATGNGSSTSTTPDATCNSLTEAPYGSDSTADLCASWPAGTTPGGIGTDANGQWTMQMTGTITIPDDITQPPGLGVDEWCVADAQNFTMSIDGQLALTNIEYETAGGQYNFNFQGHYVTTIPAACQYQNGTPGTHTVTITLVGSPSQLTSYNLGYDPVADTDGGPLGINYGVPLTWLDPAYGLQSSTTDPDGDTTTTSYTNAADGIEPQYGLVTSTTQDPAGQDLTTTTAYEDPAQGGYLRKTATTLPAGNQTTYAYYTGTGGPAAAACGVTSSTPQGGQLEQQTNPAPGGSGQSRVEQFIYDATGRQAGVRVGSPSDISGQPWRCTSYDAIGRITSQTWPATRTAPARTVSYAYDVGNDPLVSSVTDASGTITATVDLLGRLVSYTDALGQTTSYTYNQAGQTTTTTFDPASQDTVTQYGYDPNSGNQTTITVGSTVLATASYSATTGQMTGVAYGNGTTATLGYNAYGTQDNIAYSTTSTGDVFDADALTDTLAGRYATETTSQGTGTLDITYGYDGAGRLTSADDAIGSTTTDNTYSYAASPGCTATGDDANAGENTNISGVTSTTGTTTSTTSYCYNTADQLISSEASGTTSTSYAYSEDGDQTSDDGTSYTWDASDRVATATKNGTTITSTYDALNRLIESSQSGGSTVLYSYDGWTDAPAAVLNSSDAVLQQFVSLPGGINVTLQSSGNVWSYTNLQGDTTATTNSAGTLTGGPVTYNPWGVLNPSQATAPANAAGPNTLGAYATSGKLTDQATGTVLLGARTFNPTEARFLSIDPVNGGCANPYTYAFGNPLTGGDLTGQAGCSTTTRLPSTSASCHGFLKSECTLTFSLPLTMEVAGMLNAYPDVAPAVVAGVLATGCLEAIEDPAAAGICSTINAAIGLFGFDQFKNSIEAAASAGGDFQINYHSWVLPYSLSYVTAVPCKEN